MSQIPFEIEETRASLLSRSKFIATILYRLRIETNYEDRKFISKTDGEAIWFGQDFIERPLGERLFIMAHELIHIMMDHLQRAEHYEELGFGPDMKPFSFDRWSRAADYVTNDIVVNWGVGIMPSIAMYSYEYRDMLVDVVYEKLSKEEEKNNKQNQGQQGTGNFDTHKKPKPGMDKGQKQIKQDKLKSAVAAAAQAAKEAGEDISALGKFVEQTSARTLDAKDVLRDFLVQFSGTDETSWSKIHRRTYAFAPHIPMPGRTGYSMGCLLVAIDTSGSIEPKMIGQFLSWMKDILEQIRPREIHLVWWDTKAVHVELDPSMDLEEVDRLQAQGGGGTLYRCVTEFLSNEAEFEPNAVVCLTDGLVSWPHPDSMKYPHITVCTENRKTPFGVTVYMGEQQ